MGLWRWNMGRECMLDTCKATWPAVSRSKLNLKANVMVGGGEINKSWA